MPTFNPFGERDDILLSLVNGVLKGEQIEEEKDVDDSQTADLFANMNDEPELQKIHHMAVLSVYDPHTRQTTKFTIGQRTLEREPTESAKDFKNRAMNVVLDGHSSYNHMNDESTQHSSYSPYADFDELAKEEGTHTLNGSPQWMHAAAGDDHELTIGNDANDALSTQVHHFLRVDHSVPKNKI